MHVLELGRYVAEPVEHRGLVLGQNIQQFLGLLHLLLGWAVVLKGHGRWRLRPGLFLILGLLGQRLRLQFAVKAKRNGFHANTLLPDERNISFQEGKLALQLPHIVLSQAGLRGAGRVLWGTARPVPRGPRGAVLASLGVSSFLGRLGIAFSRFGIATIRWRCLFVAPLRDAHRLFLVALSLLGHIREPKHRVPEKLGWGCPLLVAKQLYDECCVLRVGRSLGRVEPRARCEEVGLPERTLGGHVERRRGFGRRGQGAPINTMAILHHAHTVAVKILLGYLHAVPRKLCVGPPRAHQPVAVLLVARRKKDDDEHVLHLAFVESSNVLHRHREH